jgi:hypothetical protein
MYNVRNVCGKDLAIQLEKGGVILRPNKCTDLDLRCSRKWINSNFDIRKLITKGFLQVTHDSRVVLPSAPVRPVIRVQPVVADDSRTVSSKPVEIIDLVSFPDVEITDIGRVSVAKPEVEPITVPDLPVSLSEPVSELVEVVSVAAVEEAVPELVEVATVEEAVPVVAVETAPIVVEVEPVLDEKKSEEASVYGGFDKFSKKKKIRR